jgi:hypothetical protein
MAVDDLRTIGQRYEPGGMYNVSGTDTDEMRCCFGNTALHFAALAENEEV